MSAQTVVVPHSFTEAEKTELVSTWKEIEAAPISHADAIAQGKDTYIPVETRKQWLADASKYLASEDKVTTYTVTPIQQQATVSQNVPSGPLEGIFGFKGVAIVNPLTGQHFYETTGQRGEKLVTVATFVAPVGVAVGAAKLGLGRASSLLAQTALGGGLAAGSEYVATGQVTAQTVALGMAGGVAFGVVGGKVNTLLKLTGGGVKPVLGRVAVNAALGAGFGAGEEYITTRQVTPIGVASGVAFGAAFGVVGEAAVYSASKLNTRYGLSERPVVKRLSGAVASFDEGIGGVPASRVVGGRELAVETAKGSDVKLARITQLDVESTRISKSQAELFRGASAKEISFAGVERRTVLVGGEAPEPSFVKPVYRKGAVKDYVVDIDSVLAYESERAVASTLTKVGEDKTALAYLNQFRESRQFESTRVAQPYIESAAGKDVLWMREQRTNVPLRDAPVSVSKVFQEYNAVKTVKLRSGIGQVGDAKDSNVLMLTKRVKASGAVPEGKVVYQREITGVQVRGTIDESLGINAIKALPKDVQGKLYTKMGGGVYGDLPLEYENMLRAGAKSKAGNFDAIPGLVNAEKTFISKQKPFSASKPKMPIEPTDGKGLVSVGKAKSVINGKVDLAEGILSVAPKTSGLSIRESIAGLASTSGLGYEKAKTQEAPTLAMGGFSEKTVNPFTRFRGKSYYKQAVQAEEETVISYPSGSGLRQPVGVAGRGKVGGVAGVSSAYIFGVGIGKAEDTFSLLTTKVAVGTSFKHKGAVLTGQVSAFDTKLTEEVAPFVGYRSATDVFSDTVLRTEPVPKPVFETKQVTTTVNDLFGLPPGAYGKFAFPLSEGKFEGGGFGDSFGRKRRAGTRRKRYPILSAKEFLDL